MTDINDAYASPRIAKSLSKRTKKRPARIDVKMKGKREISTFVRSVYAAQASALQSSELYGQR